MGLEIKGIVVPALLVRLDKNRTIEENIEEFNEKLSTAFFKGSMAVIDFNGMSINDEEEKILEDILKKYNTKIMGYRSSQGNEKREMRSLDEIKEKKSLMIINKTLRGGQRIEHDGDVLIIGNVNPNAYIVASGNIIVMGTLRGIIHAGANGDETAVVMGLRLKPQQIRIASFLSRTPDDVEIPKYPEKAFVENNQIYIEKL
jgi:septum site-determining protein MinC